MNSLPEETIEKSFSINHLLDVSMNEYLIFTLEGETIAPNHDVEVEDCQLLGRVQASTAAEAQHLLLKENPWIEAAGFTESGFILEQIVSNEQLSDIRLIINYLDTCCLPAYLALSLNRLKEMVHK